MEEHRLCKLVYLVSRKSKKKTSWCGNLKKILVKYDLKYLWDDEKKLFNLDHKGNNEAKSSKEHLNFWRSFIYKHVFKYEEKKWKKEVESKDKLRTYRLLKSSLRLEKYLLTHGYLDMSSLRSCVLTL